jgi:hypothetical protein
MVACGLPLRGPLEEPFGEVALYEGEEDDDRDRGDHDRGHKQVLLDTLFGDEVVEPHDHDLLLDARDKRERQDKLVLGQDESVDGRGHHA